MNLKLYFSNNQENTMDYEPKQFKDYVKKVPDNFEAESVALAYALKNLEKHMWRLFVDNVLPNFRQNNPIRLHARALTDIGNLKSPLDNIACERIPAGIDLNFKELFPLCDMKIVGSELNFRSDNRWTSTQVFYGPNLLTKENIKPYNPNHKRSRPLPNEITWTNMECAFIRRYAKCLTSTKAYAEKYGSPSDKKNVSRAANALLKHVEGIIDLPY